MRVLGLALARDGAAGAGAAGALVLLDARGETARVAWPASLLDAATAVGRLAGGEPFLLGVDVPVVVPAAAARTRPVENLIRRRLGLRLPPGGRAALGTAALGVAGEALLAGLAAVGLPCLPYPDRSGRRSGLAETHPEAALKILLWEGSPLAQAASPAAREELLRAIAPPPYHAARLGARASWADHAAAVDLVLRSLGDVAGFDLQPARESLGRAESPGEVERAAQLLDALLIAGTIHRWVARPETCVFVGDQESGYLILPADGFVRRLALRGGAETRDRLFPQESLRERLGREAQLRPLGLLDMPGRPHRTQAEFETRPCYEFDNLDEMLWWKHCRHVAGPLLPTEGLRELEIVLGEGGPGRVPLKLQRSRHRTLSFRFEPPGAWRSHIPTRDGRTYGFRVLRAVYETLPAES